MRNIDELPENDIPDSLWLTLHHSNDVDNADINRTGYVADDLSMKAETTDTSCETTLIPMTSSGIVDVNCSDLSSLDMRENLHSRYRSDKVLRIDGKESTSSQLSSKKLMC